MSTRNITGKKISTIRKFKGLTQEQLAARLNAQGIDIDRPVISKIENQTRELLDYEVKGIVDALGVSVEELFNEQK